MVQARRVAPSARTSFWPAVVLVLVTLVIYYPSLHGVFVLDDKEWIVESEPYYRDVAGLLAMWLHPGALPQYFPLTGTSFWLDFHFWGFWPLPYHVENVLLHAACALLLWRLLRRLEVPWAWFGAALFAWHPMMASSVTWVTERKNVLSTVLFLAALLSYGAFANWWKAPATDDRRAWLRYALAAVLYFAALMAKATTLFFPAVALLIAWWKRPALKARDAWCTLPLLLPGLALGVYFVWVERGNSRAVGPDFDFSIFTRIVLAGRSLLFYLETFLWPVALSPLYTRWPVSGLSWSHVVYPLAALALLVAPWAYRRRLGRGLAAGLFAWAGMLSPMLGFFNLAGMRLSFVWDHLAYLPNLALATVIAGGLGNLTQRVGIWPPRVVKSVAAAALVLLAVLTWRQSSVYQNAAAIWRQTLRYNPTSWAAHYKYGVILSEEGHTQEAIAHLKEALVFKPNYPEAMNDLGLVLKGQGDLEGATTQLRRAVALRPHNPVYLHNLAEVLLDKGQDQEAISLLREVVRLAPYDVSARAKLIQAERGGSGAH